jgi:hypothetical protein
VMRLHHPWYRSLPLQHIFFSGKNHPGHDGHRIVGEMVITLMLRVMRDMSDPAPTWEEVTHESDAPLPPPLVSSGWVWLQDFHQLHLHYGLGLCGGDKLSIGWYWWELADTGSDITTDAMPSKVPRTLCAP